jgi:hypothetical protein
VWEPYVEGISSTAEKLVATALVLSTGVRSRQNECDAGKTFKRFYGFNYRVREKHILLLPFPLLDV